MRYPINRQHGGTVFTTIIFVMMLISTALMYYYFQRTRNLERQIFALKNGEQLPSQSDGFFAFTGWQNSTSETEHDQSKDASSAAPADTPSQLTMPADATSAMYEPEKVVPSTVSQANSAGAPNQTHESMASTAIVDSDQSSSPLAQDRLTPAEQFSTSEEVNSEAPNLNGNRNDRDAAGLETNMESSDDSRSESPSSEGQSLYNMDPPTVRVRAPRR